MPGGAPPCTAKHLVIDLLTTTRAVRLGDQGFEQQPLDRHRVGSVSLVGPKGTGRICTSLPNRGAVWHMYQIPPLCHRTFSGIPG
jgi:hypothetical protein